MTHSPELQGHICRHPHMTKRLLPPPQMAIADVGTADAVTGRSYTSSPLAGQPVLSLRNIACRGRMSGGFTVRHLLPHGQQSLRDRLQILDRQNRQPFEAGQATRVIDITEATGKRVAGPFTHWQTTIGLGFPVEHLAGPDPDDRLLVFSQIIGQPWQWQDLTTVTNQTVEGPVTYWQRNIRGNFVGEYLAARDRNGQVLVFQRTEIGGDWTVDNLTQATGQRLATPLTSWQVSLDTTEVVEHLAGTADNGDLILFWRSLSQDWQVVNVTQVTGQKTQGAPESWTTRDNDSIVEHLAAQSPTGDLLEFHWVGGRGWRFENVTQTTGRKIAGPVTSWSVGDEANTVAHLAGPDPNGHLLVFWRAIGGQWQVVDVTAMTAVKVAGRPTAYQVKQGDTTVELLATLGLDDYLYLHWWTPSLDWQTLELSQVAGEAAFCEPMAWVNNGSGERIAVQGAGRKLIIFEGGSRARLLTDDMQRPWGSYQRQRHIRRKLLTLLIDPNDPDLPAPSRAQVESLLYGPTDSLRDYFLEVSNGHFVIENAGILGQRNPGSTAEPGWYDADHPHTEYAIDKRDIGTEAARKAAQEFNFRAFDENGDGRVDPHELGILFMTPDKGYGGGLIRRLGKDFVDRADKQGIEVDGIDLKSGVAQVLLGRFHGVISHEIAHLLLGLGDMYVEYHTPAAANVYSLMDNHFDGPHLDGFSKLKLGWVRPRILWRSGRYTLPDVETRHVVWILVNPQRSTQEYFLIENRWGGTTYDRILPDAGLAVWHVMEESCLSGQGWMEPPPNIPPDDWGRQGLGGIRRAVRLIRPDPTYDEDTRALWDDGWYDLLSEDDDPKHAELRWADGTPSGFALRRISAAGPDMQVSVEVPFIQGW